MNKQDKIPVHRMDDWFAGVYVKSFSEVKAFGPGYEVSKPHRHDFYYCVLLEKGKLEMEVDLSKICLTDGTMFLSYTGQIHHIISAEPGIGWFLAFDPTIIDTQLKDILDQCLSEVIIAPASEAKWPALSSLIGNLYSVYQDTDQLFRIPVRHAIVSALLYQLVSAYLSVESAEFHQHSARSIEIVKRLKQLLRRQNDLLKKPSEISSEMHITTSHLNDTVKAVTGFSVTQLIQQEIMREAKRQLYHSGRTVKEIALSLGFDDAQYFTRLFTKVTGTSPTKLRRNARLIGHSAKLVNRNDPG